MRNKIGTAVAVAAFAVMGVLASAASADPLNCSGTVGFGQHAVIQPQGATSNPNVTANVYGQPGFVGIRGGDGAAWVISFTTTTLSPTFGTSWVSLGGSLHANSFVKLTTRPFTTPGGFTAYATHAFVIGADGNTYFKRYSNDNGWSGWYAHSTGASYFNSLPTQAIISWSVWLGGSLSRHFWLSLSQFWTAPVFDCFYQDS